MEEVVVVVNIVEILQPVVKDLEEILVYLLKMVRILLAILVYQKIAEELV